MSGRRRPAESAQREDKRTHRTHQQGDRGEKRHFGQRDAELLADLGVHKHDQEVVVGVHGPAQKGAEKRVALLASQAARLFGVEGHE